MMPLQSIMAQMRTNAEVQGRAQATKIAEEQKEKASNTKIELNPDGSITAKNIDPSILNGTQDQEIRDAAQKPKDAVNAKLEGFGFVPKDTNIVDSPEKVDQYTERYRARRQLGGSVIKSALMAGLTGGRTDEKLRENLQNQNAAQNSATLQKYVSPIEDQNLEAGRLAASMAGEQRLSIQASQKEDQDAVELISKTDWTAIPTHEREAALADLMGDPEKARRYGRVVRRVVQQQDEKKRVGAIESFRKDNAALGQFKSWDEAKKAVGVPMRPEEEGPARADFEAARNSTLEKRQEQELKWVREKRLSDAEDRRVRGAEEKESPEEKRNSKQIDDLTSRIDKNNERIRANSLKFAELDPDEKAAARAELQKQNAGMQRENLRLRNQLDGIIPRSAKKAVVQQSHDNDVQKFGKDLASKIKAAIDAGFSREQAIQRLEEAGIVKPNQISEMKIPDQKQQNPGYDPPPLPPQPSPKKKQPPRPKPVEGAYA
jgi:hypothetical protein